LIFGDDFAWFLLLLFLAALGAIALITIGVLLLAWLLGAD
jgi:hypothetical protein